MPQAKTDPRLPSPCCIRALAGQWQIDRIVLCPECLRPYTAVVQGGEHSWWPGLVVGTGAHDG